MKKREEMTTQKEIRKRDLRGDVRKKNKEEEIELYSKKKIGRKRREWKK
jgi:hypothetical protein